MGHRKYDKKSSISKIEVIMSYSRNPWAQSLLLEQKPVLYQEWSVMVETHSLYRQEGKKISHGGVFDLAVEQPQLFRKRY